MERLIMKNLKYIPWLIVILMLGGVSFYYYRDAQSTAELLSMKNKELMTANLELGRAHTIITDQKKVHRAALADIEDSWKKEIDKRKALIVAFGQMEARYEAEKRKVKTITKVRWRDRNTDRVIDLPKGKIFIRQDNGEYKEITSLTYGYKDFRISIKGDAIEQTLSYKLTQRFRGQMVATLLPNGAKNHYVKIFELDDKGKAVKELELEHLDVLTSNDLPKRMMWFNPKLDLGIGAGVNSKLVFTWVADFGFSFAAYGVTKDDITWRFLRVGTGLSNHGFSLTFSPAQLNIGKFLPVVSNIWLTPYAGYEFGTPAAHFGLGMSLVF